MSGAAALLANPDRGGTATFRPGGTGPQTALRVVRAEPAEGEDAVLVAAAVTLPAITAGDTFEIGGEVLTVLSADTDAAGTAWRVVCTR
ncbi:head-tail joining protein [Falsiroseomonas ponticola]|uniref:head-tail joining protein n=1 Tax=Falsiroseomonas ponticola TaxID=2786951 RepID=UPI0019346C6E|nr:hypothetical protein [Roseomonas ponticola]